MGKMTTSAFVEGRKYKLCIFLLLVSPTLIFAKSGWEWRSPIPQGNHLNGVYAYNNSVVYAVGNVGTFLKSTNGGQRWEVQHRIGNSASSLNAVLFTTEQDGMVVGDSGIVMFTTNGGNSWLRKSIIQFTGSWNSIHRVGTTYFVLGDSGVLLRSTNSGVTWSASSLPGGKSLRSAYFLDPARGWIAGDNGILYRTYNGGNAWEILSTGFTFDLMGAYFVHPDTGWVFGQAGLLLSTTNGDSSANRVQWTIAHSRTTKTISQLRFINRRNGIGLAGTDIIYTANGGFSWNSERIDSIDSPLSQFAFGDHFFGWAVGANGEIKQTIDGGRRWYRITRGLTGEFFSLSFTDSRTGWAVGDAGKIVKTTNGGTQWSVSTTPTDRWLRSVSFATETIGSAVGDGGTILYTNDGGKTWQAASSGTENDFTDVFFVNSTTAFAIGKKGTFATTFDGGGTWTSQTLDTSYILTSINFVNDSVGCMIVNYGTSFELSKILRTTTAGASWDTVLARDSIQISDTLWYVQNTTALHALYFVNEDIGWAVGRYKKIYKTTNGGRNWFPQKSPGRIYTHWSSVHFFNSTHGWVVGVSGNIARTTNGGNDWFMQYSPTSNYLSDIFAIDTSQACVVGSGTILFTDDGGGPPMMEDGGGGGGGGRFPPLRFLQQTFPNPYVASQMGNLPVTIMYTLRNTGPVSLVVYDVLGREVAVLVNQVQAGLRSSAPPYIVNFDIQDLSTGVYFYRLTTPDFVETQKMLIIR